MTPRTRSPAPDGDNDDREHRRSERRESRRRTGSEPIGMAFKLNSCERSLRGHHNELGAQSIGITQLTEAVQRLTADKDAQDQRLNGVFQHIDVKFTEAMTHMNDSMTNVQKHHEVTNQRMETLMTTLNSLTQGFHQRLEQLMMELYAVKRSQTSVPSSVPLIPPDLNVPLTPQVNPSAPEPPRSWTQAPPPPPTHIPSATSHGNSGGLFSTTSGSHEQVPEHVQGSRSATTTFHNIGSPLSANASPFGGQFNDQRPQSVPTFGRWAPGAGTENQPFDPRAWSTDGKKVTKELKTYDGDMAHYDNWRRRIRDHFVNTNHNYSKVLDFVECAKKFNLMGSAS